jgi:transcriptional regulator with XRE-family HTH domain
VKDRIFWQLIRRARERRGITQTVLAERIGMQRTNLSTIEAGRGNVTEDTMIKVAQALGTDLRALLLEELVGEALTKPGPVKTRTK